MKKRNLKVLSAVISAAMLLSAAPVFAAEQDGSVYYEYRFNDAADMTALFSGDGSTFSVEDGMGKIVTLKPSGSARQVYASFDQNKPIHKIGEGETDTFEVRVKFEKGTTKYLFGPHDSKNSTSNGTLLKFGNTAGTLLRGADDVNFNAEAKMLPGEWQQLFFVFNNDKYDLYINGVKASNTSVDLKGKAANTLNITQIDKFLFQGNKNTTTPQTTWIDDVIAQKLVPLYLTGSTVENNAENVSVETKTVTLDFNTIIDSTALSALTVKAGERVLADTEYTAAVNSSDVTKVDITFNGALQGSTAYTIDYTGIKDVINTGDAACASGSLTFTTEEKTVPFEMTGSENTADTAVDGAVTVKFNKTVDPETLSGITLSPSALFTAAADGASIVITPDFNWLANKEYTISLNNVGAADKTVIEYAEIKFKTIENPYFDVGSGGDYSWLSTKKVNASAAAAQGICAISYAETFKDIAYFDGKSDIPLLYKDTLGSGTDTVTGSMVCAGSGVDSVAIVYKLKRGLGTFSLNTAEKTAADMGTVEIYGAPYGCDYKNTASYTRLDAVRTGGELTTLWNSDVYYTVSANDTSIGYVMVVLNKPEGRTQKTVYTPALRSVSATGADGTLAYLAQNGTAKTVDISFGGLLDLASVADGIFTVSDRNVIGTEIVKGEASLQNTVRLTVDTAFSEGSEYTVGVSGAKDIYGNDIAAATLEFTAVSGPVAILKTGAVSVPEGSRYAGTSAKLIIAYYKDNGLLKADISDVTLNAGENAFDMPVTAEGEKAVIMLWTSLDSASPVCKSQTVQ